MKGRKVGVMGTGHLGQALIRGFVEKKIIDPKNIYCTNRSEVKLQKVKDLFGVQALNSNEELIDKCDVIILAVKPNDLLEALDPLTRLFEDYHVVISLAAGLSLNTLQKQMPKVKSLVRVMANVPTSLGLGVMGYALAEEAQGIEYLVKELFTPMGLTIPAPEGEAFEAVTVACAAGTGFVLEIMTYWQEWLEQYGFDAETARSMTTQVFLGAAQFAQHIQHPFEELQKQVATSKTGVTSAGLDSMHELEIERLLRYSFEKALMRDRELGKKSNQNHATK